MLEFEYNLVGYPFNKFLHDQAQFFLVFRENSSHEQSITINFDTLNYLKHFIYSSLNLEDYVRGTAIAMQV